METPTPLIGLLTAFGGGDLGSETLETLLRDFDGGVREEPLEEPGDPERVGLGSVATAKIR